MSRGAHDGTYKSSAYLERWPVRAISGVARGIGNQGISCIEFRDVYSDVKKKRDLPRHRLAHLQFSRHVRQKARFCAVKHARQ